MSWGIAFRVRQQLKGSLYALPFLGALLSPLLSGALLLDFWWGSVFLITLPLAVVALLMAVALVPSHVNETTDPVDHLGGILSVLLVAGLVLGINVAAVPNAGALTLGPAVVAAAAGSPS
jgi:MFS transporter, DHA2 family, multidrug resistance protein